MARHQSEPVAPVINRFHPDNLLVTGPNVPDEPVLAVDDIQGNILPGFGTTALVLLGLKLDAGAGGPPAARRWLRSLATVITTLGQVNMIREVRRAVARATAARPNTPDVMLNVALSFPVLEPLGLPVALITDGPFRGGMAGTDLQDPIGPTGEPIGWVVGATPATTPDVLVIVASDYPQALESAVAAVVAGLGASGFRAIYRDDGQRLPGSIEHFGFRDDISQPGVRGRLSQRPDHVLTRRYFANSDPRQDTHARPGQPLLWPGQFLFGYPTQLSSDPLTPGPEAMPPEPWMRNGSFLVLRRLRQDVAAFRRFGYDQAPLVSTHLGRPVSAEEVQAWIVGRWPDGTPLTRSPAGPDPALAKDDMAVNFFGYAGDEPDAQVVEDGIPRSVPGNPSDSEGLRCPHFAHVRKVNLRDKPTDQGPSNRFRILRRGIPYGPLFQEGERPGIDRGLLFLAYMRSPEQQFLTLSATWMNSPLAPEGFGHDLLVGQNRMGRSAERMTADGHTAPLIAQAGSAWVLPTGGGFFFSPAVSVLRSM